MRPSQYDVERGIPDKSELTVYCKLANDQMDTYRAVLKNNVDLLNGGGGERVKLLNIIMQLRKACNHPYLFDGVEDKTLDPFGEHLVTNSGTAHRLQSLWRTPTAAVSHRQVMAHSCSPYGEPLLQL